MSRAVDARVRALRDLRAVAGSRSGARVRQVMDAPSAYEAILALRAAIAADDGVALAVCGMLVSGFAVVDLLDSDEPDDDDEPEAQA